MDDVGMSLDSRSRLAALQQLELLDTPAEEVFDRLASLAAKVLHVPVVLMSLLPLLLPACHRLW